MAISEQRKKELDAWVAQQTQKAQGLSGGLSGSRGLSNGIPTTAATQGLSGPANSAQALQPSRLGTWGQKALGVLQSVGEALQGAGVEMMSPVTRTLATGLSAGRGAYNLATGNIEAEQKAQAAEASGPPQYKPYRTAGTIRDIPAASRDIIGGGAQLGAIALAPTLGAGISSLAPSASPILTGALTGGTVGLVGGFGRALQEAKGSPLKQTADVLMGTAQGGTAGLAGGAAAGALTPSPTQEKVRRISGQITQGKKERNLKAAEQALKTMSRKELEKVESYDDLANLADENVSAMAGAQDDLLATDATSYDLESFNRTFGGEKRNYFEDAFKGLEETYVKTKDWQALAELEAFRNRAVNEGLTLQEWNQFTRTYGTEVASKAFTKSGEPSTSVTKQALEQVRTSMKKAIAELFDDGEAYRAYDQAMSSMIKLRTLAEKNVEKVQGLLNKITDRKLLERLGRVLGIGLNKLTGGSLKAFTTSFFPSNVGQKELNYIGIQKMLNANLLKLDYLMKLPQSKVVSWLISTVGATAQVAGKPKKK